MIEIEVRQDSEFATAVYDKLMANQDFTLVIHPAWTERVFEVGDKVTIYGDSGDPMPAEIIGVSEYVRVRYQVTRNRPDGFTTSLSKSSVVTDHKVEHPSRIEVKVSDVPRGTSV